MKRKLLAGAAVSGVLGLSLLAPGPAFAADPVSYQAALNPVTANHVTATGAAWVTLNGTTAEVKVQVNGLPDGLPHGQHIHINAQGTCPTQAQDHNGLPSINLTDGAPFFGSIGVSLTNNGDTSVAAQMAVTDFPSSSSYTYSRTIQLDQQVIENLQRGTAALVVHGIDYNGNGTYDDVLGPSDLDPSLPAEATDPALCGTFVLMQMAAVPAGGVSTGGGSAAANDTSALATAGVAALLAAGAVGVVGYRRRWSIKG